MPSKSKPPSRKAAWIAKRRILARANGLCITCCKRRSQTGHAVCEECTKSAAQRANHRRSTLRKRAELRGAVEAQEHAGDLLREHHHHMDAAQRYQDALNVEEIFQDDRLRIYEKLGEVLSVGSNPEDAKSWYDRLLRLRQMQSVNRIETTISAMSKTRRHLWITSQTKSMLPLLEQMMRIAQNNGDPELVKVANVEMANALVLLGRYEEVEKSLKAAGSITGSERASTQSLYWTSGGFMSAALGREKEAFEHFKHGLEVSAREDSDAYGATVAWSNYALAAMMLGRTQIAKNCYERALLVARERNVIWRIPQLYLHYARFLEYTGHYAFAYNYLLDALSFDAQAVILDQDFAWAGIPLALHMNDEVTLEKCVRSHVIEEAFLSNEPGRIGVIAAAFARLYGERGHPGKARALLHRAITSMCDIVDAWDLPIEVARYGALADILPARRLLEERAAYPCAEVAEAYIRLFDAFVAQRRGRAVEVQRQARDAVTRFEALGWYGCSDRARTLLPAEQRSIDELPLEKSFVELNVQFTKREREVAALVLQGLTSRAIADRLAISPHTVDSHVNSLMSRLGIHSRHQLIYILGETGRQPAP